VDRYKTGHICSISRWYRNKGSRLISLVTGHLSLVIGQSATNTSD